MVFYRKYRPQSLEELVGQSQVSGTLLKAFQAQKLAHAYLFCGPKGTGKTSTARILAKMINCESPDKAPCNSCFSCTSITDGSNLDLIEIDAASNRGIDDIRDLREKIKLVPTSATKKVYIIDEVHMLTTEAFNALLKTLEEPPSHVLFILATTELHKIPATILSRVQKLDFKEANSKDLLEVLKKVVSKEKIKADEEALLLLAKKSEGSFRDSLKLLDQLSSTGEKITADLVNQALKSADFESVISLLEKIYQNDSKAALEQVLVQVEAGVNIKDFCLSILDALRAMLFIKNQVGQAVKEDLGTNKYEVLKDLSGSFSLEKILQIMENIHKGLETIKVASIPSLPLEIAVVESCLGNVEFRIKNEELVQPKEISHSETIKLTKMVQANVILRRNEMTIPESDSGHGSTSLTTGARMTVEETPTTNGGVDDVASGDIVTLRDKWNYVLETVKPYNYSLEALLKQAKLLSCKEGRVVLEVPYSFHQRILEAPKSRELLESVLADVLGKTAKVSCVLGKRPTRVEEIANVEIAADDEVIRVAAEIFNSES